MDEVIHFEGKVPREVKIKDKTVSEKLQLIEQLEDEDKQAVYRIIDGMLTKTKFKIFFPTTRRYFVKNCQYCHQHKSIMAFRQWQKNVS